MELADSGAKAEEEQCHFQFLPDELVDMILVQLSLADKKAGRLVCSSWNRRIEGMLSYNFPLSRTTLADFQAREYEVNWLRVNLINLTFPDVISASVKSSLSSVRRLTFNGRGEVNEDIFVDSKKIRSLLKNCTRLQELDCLFCGLDSFRTTSILDLSMVKLEHLTALHLVCSIATSDIVLAMFQLQTPNLSSLSFSAVHSHESIAVSLSFHRFLVQNKGTLKTLNFSFVHTNFTEEDLGSEFVSGLKEIQLDALTISPIPKAESNAEHPLLNTLLGHQNSLKEFNISSVSSGLYSAVQALLLRNRGTLLKFSMAIWRCGPFDDTVLTRLTRLTDFTFICHCSHSPLDFYNIPRSISFLTWYAPLSAAWFQPEAANAFPHLKTMNLGRVAQNIAEPFNLSLLCSTLFGTTDRRSKLERLELSYKPNVQQTLALQAQDYHVEGNYGSIYIRR